MPFTHFSPVHATIFANSLGNRVGFSAIEPSHQTDAPNRRRMSSPANGRKRRLAPIGRLSRPTGGDTLRVRNGVAGPSAARQVSLSKRTRGLKPLSERQRVPLMRLLYRTQCARTPQATAFLGSELQPVRSLCSSYYHPQIAYTHGRTGRCNGA